MPGTFYLDSHGCAKNQVDGELLIAHLCEAGWTLATDAETADLLIVNSCGFIESAKKESIEAVLSYKAVYPGKKILLAGCLSQRYADELASELTEADALFGNADLSEITRAAEMALASSHRALIPELDPGGKKDFAACFGTRPLLSLPGSAYVKITEGCNNWCSFCAIPLIRGPLRSRSIPDIVDECKALLKRGIRELCLIGQDLGSFGMDGAAAVHEKGSCLLPQLLRELSTLEGNFWVRLLYIHPDNFPEDILAVCKRDARILPYFDLPFQHASPSILAAMNRKGNPRRYLDLIDRIRGELPDAVIRSTFLVGFPGETEKDFKELQEFQLGAELDWLGIFTYSREEDTAAFALKGKVAKKYALERKRLLEEAQVPISERRMQRFVGRTLDLLVEEKVENEEGLYLGRAFCQAPDVDGATVINSDTDLQAGSLIRGKIFARAGFDLDAAYRDDE